jgi:hypothetical protein
MAQHKERNQLMIYSVLKNKGRKSIIIPISAGKTLTKIKHSFLFCFVTFDILTKTMCREKLRKHFHLQ